MKGGIASLSEMYIDTNLGTVWIDQADLFKGHGLSFPLPDWFNCGTFGPIDIQRYQFFHILDYHESNRLSIILPTTQLINSYRTFDIYKVVNVRQYGNFYSCDNVYHHLYAFNDPDDYMFFMMIL
jgi:hypothetical protein